MAKRKHRKNASRHDNPTPVSTVPPVKPAAPAGGPLEVPPIPDQPSMPNAATLVEEVQQRCERLRQWQREAQQSLQLREEVVARREKDLDQIQECVEYGRTRLEIDQDALKRARLMLDKEKAQTEQTQQAQEAERRRLERTRKELIEQQQAMQEQREELDAEWANLTRVRKAQEALAEAMEAERTRLRELQTSDSLARVGIDGDGAQDGSEDPDDTPGLTLTQAA